MLRLVSVGLEPEPTFVLEPLKNSKLMMFLLEILAGSMLSLSTFSACSGEDQILDVETLRELVFRFSGFMPENDGETKAGFMNISFGILFGDCRVLQFEGMVEVFAFEEYGNLLSRQAPRRFGGVRHEEYDPQDGLPARA